MMRQFVFDTNIISYLLNEHSFLELYEKYFFGTKICISFMTEAELLRGAYKKKWGTRKLENLKQFIARCKILQSNSKIADLWATIKELPGKNVSDGDAWVAATALGYDLPLVSHNAKDFRFIPDLNLLTESIEPDR